MYVLAEFGVAPLPIYSKTYCLLCQTLCLGMGDIDELKTQRSLFIYSLELGVGKAEWIKPA